MIDNLIIGNLSVSEKSLGILETDKTIRLSINEANNKSGKLWLPHILKTVGLFKSTSEVLKIGKQRILSNKIKDIKEKQLDRIIIEPECTRFKIGKKVFWLFVNV